MEVVELQRVVSIACKLSRMGLQAAGLMDENADSVKSTLQAREKEKTMELNINRQLLRQPAFRTTHIHDTTTTHVTKGSLSRTVRSSTTNTRNTSNSMTRSPGLGQGLVTSFDGDGIGLTLILCDGSVHTVHQVGTDGSLEDGGKRNSRTIWRGRASSEDVDLRTGGLEKFC